MLRLINNKRRLINAAKSSSNHTPVMMYSTEKPAENNTKTENPVDEKDKQIAQLQDQFRRALADAENVRTRAKKEVEQAKSFSIGKFAKDLLESADVLNMAIKSVPKDQLTDNNKLLKDLHEGVSLTRNELLKAFKRHGLEEFDPTGEVFDCNFHQAMFKAPIPDKEPNTVFQTTLLGYKLNGRVVRPAQVGVVEEMKK